MKGRMTVICLLVILCISAAFPVVYASDTAALYDGADLLTDVEEEAIVQKLEAVSAKYEAQIVIATIAALEDESIDEYINTLYDKMGFGYGDNRDGVLLVVCMDPREYRILSNGYAADAIEMDTIDAIGEEMVPNLSGGDYTAAFLTYIDECEYYLDGHLNGFPFDFTLNLGIAVAIGLLVGLITATVLKGQLKTVRKQYKADSYVKKGSLQVTMNRDVFLYQEISRIKKESSDSKSSKSGSSRNVGGGSF